MSKPIMMSFLPLSICMSGIEITTDDGVIARCDRNHCNETTDSVTHLCHSVTHLIHIGRKLKGNLTSVIWNHSYHLKMFLLKLIPHFTQFTSNLNLHTNSHVPFIFFFFWSPFVGLPFFDVLYAVRDRFEQRGEMCTKSSISFKIKAIFLLLLYSDIIIIIMDIL